MCECIPKVLGNVYALSNLETNSRRQKREVDYAFIRATFELSLTLRKVHLLTFNSKKKRIQRMVKV